MTKELKKLIETTFQKKRSKRDRLPYSVSGRALIATVPTAFREAVIAVGVAAVTKQLLESYGLMFLDMFPRRSVQDK